MAHSSDVSNQNEAVPTYNSQRVETKWQDRWAREKTWEVRENTDKKKYYLLDMFPYPSGRLHMGHVRNYTLGDVIGRYRRAQGYNVLHPMGWDAFGLPAENAAIKNKTHPEKWTLENIQTMKKQLQRLGLGYDWSREITTCLPEYYKWEQLLFTEMFRRDLAYKKKSTVNWCPSCNTVLANEQVEDGRCWRCDSETTTKELEQWFLRITRYAEELLKGLETLTGWPEKVRLMQTHWIGRSEGTEIQFEIEGLPAKGPTHGNILTVFTTRPDTLMGVTFVAIAPEHPLAAAIASGKNEAAVKAFAEKCRKQDKISRLADDAPKEGVDTGRFAIHPISGEKVPIFVANFVVTDYGTGALMAVPAHDIRDHAFAKAYQLPIRQVIQSADPATPAVTEAAFTGVGKLLNSGKFNGEDSDLAKKTITEALEKMSKGRKTVTYRIRDWGLSRQRYWGTPIPIIQCVTCGAVPVPERDLPVLLPKDVEFTGEGASPLSKHPAFLQVECPKCKNPNARRETDTMDTFMESSWYYLRYLSPQDTSAPFDKEAAAYWLGVDQYIGGIEHATMHLLYFRFFHKVLRDIGYLPKTLAPQDRDEPVRNLMNQGIVYKDGAKMSKSKGNVVEPDSIIAKYGADTARVFSMFAAPPEKVLEWADQGVEGASRFLLRVWRLVEKHESVMKPVQAFHGKHAELRAEASRKLRAKTHQTIQKVLGDFENGYHFNTAIAAIMELVNETYTFPLEFGNVEHLAVLRESIETTLRLLNPFAPHMTEELWERLGHAETLTGHELPKADADALVRDIVPLVVQVNGKHRGTLEISVNLTEEQVTKLAREDAKVAPHLEGKTVVRTIFVPKRLVNFVVK